MANICDNDFTLYYDDQLKIMILFAKLREAWMNSEYGHAKEMLRSLGCDEKIIDEIDGRTRVDNILLTKEDQKYVGVRVVGTSAWEPCENFIRAIQNTVTPFEYVYIAVEPGCDIFVNTDKTGRFYRETVYIDVYAKEAEETLCFCDNEMEEVAKLLKTVTHMKIDDTMDLREEKVVERVKKQFYKINPEEEGYYLNIHFLEHE